VRKPNTKLKTSCAEGKISGTSSALTNANDLANQIEWDFAPGDPLWTLHLEPPLSSNQKFGRRRRCDAYEHFGLVYQY